MCGLLALGCQWKNSMRCQWKGCLSVVVCECNVLGQLWGVRRMWYEVRALGEAFGKCAVCLDERRGVGGWRLLECLKNAWFLVCFGLMCGQQVACAVIAI